MIGINSEKFSPYQHWINYDGTCGMMSAAVLLAYYQDNIDPNIFSHSIRKPHDYNNKKLYETLKHEITTFMPKGTTIIDVSLGINRFLRKFGTSQKYKYKAHFLPTPALGVLKAHCTNKIQTPIIFGTLKILKAPTNYHNHFLLGYAIDENNIIAHDNHGRYDIKINPRWTLGCVSLTFKSR